MSHSFTSPKIWEDEKQLLKLAQEAHTQLSELSQIQSRLGTEGENPDDLVRSRELAHSIRNQIHVIKAAEDISHKDPTPHTVPRATYQMIWRLIQKCPKTHASPNCPLQAMREKCPSDQFQWLTEQSPQQLIHIIEHHQRCISH